MQQWSPALPAVPGQGDPQRCQEQGGPGHKPSHPGPREGGEPGTTGPRAGRGTAGGESRGAAWLEERGGLDIGCASA